MGLSVYLYIYLSVCLSIYLSICLSIYLSVYVSLYLTNRPTHWLTDQLKDTHKPKVYIFTHFHLYTCSYLVSQPTPSKISSPSLAPSEASSEASSESFWRKGLLPAVTKPLISFLGFFRPMPGASEPWVVPLPRCMLKRWTLGSNLCCHLERRLQKKPRKTMFAATPMFDRAGVVERLGISMRLWK